MSTIAHMTAAEKTTAIIVLAEALQAATGAGDPAPLVARLRDWMHAPLRVGDFVVKTSTAHHGPNPSRVGVVLEISRHRSAYERVTGDGDPGARSSLREGALRESRVHPPWALEQRDVRSGDEPGVGQDALIAALADAGIEIKPRTPIVRPCLNCEQQVTLNYDERRGCHQTICSCGAHCTSG